MLCYSISCRARQRRARGGRARQRAAAPKRESSILFSQAHATPSELALRHWSTRLPVTYMCYQQLPSYYQIMHSENKCPCRPHVGRGAPTLLMIMIIMTLIIMIIMIIIVIMITILLLLLLIIIIILLSIQITLINKRNIIACSRQNEEGPCTNGDARGSLKSAPPSSEACACPRYAPIL